MFSAHGMFIKKIMSLLLCALLFGLCGCTKVTADAAVASETTLPEYSAEEPLVSGVNTLSDDGLILYANGTQIVLGETLLQKLVDDGFEFKKSLADRKVLPLESPSALYLISEPGILFGIRVKNYSAEEKSVLDCPITELRIYRPKDNHNVVDCTFLSGLSMDSAEEEVRSCLGEPYLFTETTNGESHELAYRYTNNDESIKVHYIFEYNHNSAMTVFHALYWHI